MTSDNIRDEYASLPTITVTWSTRKGEDADAKYETPDEISKLIAARNAYNQLAAQKHRKLAGKAIAAEQLIACWCAPPRASLSFTAPPIADICARAGTTGAMPSARKRYRRAPP